MTPERPNILLVVVDSGRADRWLDARLAPCVARLRQDGVTFSHTIVEKASTSPCFTSLLSGLYSPRHGVHNVWGDRVPASVPLLTNRLEDAGYHAHAEVTGPLLPEIGLDRGFERYAYRVPGEYLSTAWGDGFVERLRSGLRAPWFVMLHLWELHHPRQTDGIHNAAATTDYDRAVAALDAQLGRVFDGAGDALIVFTADHGEKLAHEPYRPGTAVAYARELLRVDDAEGLLPGDVAGVAGPSVLAQFYGVASPMLRDVRIGELAARAKRGTILRFLDRVRLAALLPFITIRDLFAMRDPHQLTDLVHRRGLLDADKSRRKVERLAGLLGRDRLMDMHLRMWLNSYKHNLDEGHMLHVYDFLVRVPLVLRLPTSMRAAVASGRAFGQMVRQVDILPTLLDLVGVELPDALDGRSLVPLLRGHPWASEPAFLSVSGLPKDLELRGVRTETHKYTYGPYNPELPEELYDLAADPGEACNLAAQDRELCAELRYLADTFAADAPALDATPIAVGAADQARVEQQLRDLGYIE